MQKYPRKRQKRVEEEEEEEARRVDAADLWCRTEVECLEGNMARMMEVTDVSGFTLDWESEQKGRGEKKRVSR